jgi:hypothetical protein
MDEQGLLTIYSLENVAPKGLKPSMKLVEVGKAFYQERQVGVQRMYAALGANHRIDSLLRCYNTEIMDGMVVIPTDGKQYQVDATQKVIGKDSVDITLVRVDKLYEIYAEPTS